jgi:hypothetical protein
MLFVPLLASVHTSHARMSLLLYFAFVLILRGTVRAHRLCFMSFYFCTSTSSIPLVNGKYAETRSMLVIIKPEDVMFE